MAGRDSAMKYNPALDGLRAWAVGLVVFAHMPAVTGVDFTFLLGRFARGLHVGYLGVDIFFVLSGFLVTSILLNDKANDRYSFARFYAKRTLRIFPIFYVALALCALAFPLPASEIVSNGLYVSNYYYVFHDQSSPLRHTWSLSVEEQFYLVWPLVLYVLPFKRVGPALLIGVPLVVVASLAIAHSMMQEEYFGRLVTRGVMFRILSLGVGAILAFYVSKLKDFPLSVVVITGLLALTGHVISVLLDAPWRAILGLFSMSLLAVSIFCAAFIGYQRRHAYSRYLLEGRPIVYLGRISYGIYLYHFIILHALDARGSENPDGVPLATLLTFLALTVVVPAISFKFIESPLLRIKERLNKRPADRAPRSIAES
jgi:peptidoglycan/LPS O-acetylase OafA/YrhL